MPRASIGPYRVESELGHGGMGEVYLATDTRLDRKVAIKALPAHLADDADRLSRFQREAKVLASLNHPCIGAIYGLEESGGRQHLVLEFVEGETLSARLKRGPLPVDDALSIARQIAEALEAAHEKGVIHRDLKPGNVMVTSDGAAKVLDFGLARAGEDMPSSPSHAAQAPDSPTITSPVMSPVHSPTVPGIILGTAGYMSPEQARGKAVDKRSDIFSFGCVLYEMLSGSQPFPGETVTDSLGAILHREPQWSLLPPNTPGRIRDLLAGSLAKDRRNRLHDIGDARLELQRAIEGREWLSVGAGHADGTGHGAIRRWLPWTLAAMFLVLAAAASWRARDQRAGAPLSPRSGQVRFQVSDTVVPHVRRPSLCTVAISNDGRQVLYHTSDAALGDGLALRRADDLRISRFATPGATRAEGTQSGDPIFSPDGTWMAYFVKSALWKVPVGGGEPIQLYAGESAVQSKGGAWTDKGIIFCPAPNAGLWRVPEQGGTPETLTVPDPARDEVSHRWPDVLPDGRHALITVKKLNILTFDDAEIDLLNLDTRTWKTLIKGGSFGRYVPTGHIVFARNGALLAVPFDPGAAEVTGTPIVVVPDVMSEPDSGAAQFAVSRDSGTLVYVPGGADEPRMELVWVDWDGKVTPVGAPLMQYGATVPSPDGTRAASTVFGANDAVFVYDFARGTSTRITFRGNCGGPIWTRDSSKIIYDSDAGGPYAIYMVNADGSGQPDKVLDRSLSDFSVCAEVEGKPAVVYEEAGDILMRVLGQQTAQKLVGSQFTEIRPRLSPDGRWLSYSSNESGTPEVYVRPFPAGDGRWQVSIGGGVMSWWSPNGDSIICQTADERAFIRVPIHTASRFEADRPQPLVTLPEGLHHAQVHPDGKRLLAIRDVPRKFTADRVYAVLNWSEELSAKLPARSR